MTKIKQIAILTSIVLLSSCGSQTGKKDFEHTYSKYWEKYSAQQLTDILFSDTLMVGYDAEGDWTARHFYIDATKELLADLKDDENKIDSLYPMTAFDKLTVQKLPSGVKRTFTNEQTNKFLEIINNPLSFDWSETTYEPEYRANFLKSGKVVVALTIGADISVIRTEPDWPEFKKMKFGHLKARPKAELSRLIEDIE